MNTRAMSSITSANTNFIKHLEDSDVRTMKVREFKQNLFWAGTYPGCSITRVTRKS
jgi:hypothetical protein